jgi:hypothetical protein
MDVVELRIRDGAIEDAGSWLYAWVPEGGAGVVYVGGTGMPPALRSWLHLHGEEAGVARLVHRRPGAGAESFDVLAFRLPDDLDRSAAKRELVRQLAARSLLAPDFVGDDPGGAEEHPDALTRSVTLIADHLEQVQRSG